MGSRATLLSLEDGNAKFSGDKTGYYLIFIGRLGSVKQSYLTSEMVMRDISASMLFWLNVVKIYTQVNNRSQITDLD